MATEQFPGGPSRSAGGLRPLAQSVFNSGEVANPTAGQVICSLPTLTPRIYLVTVGTSADVGALFTNMALYSGDSMVGIVSSYDGELEAWVFHQGATISIRALVADTGFNYHVDNLTATPYYELRDAGCK